MMNCWMKTVKKRTMRRRRKMMKSWKMMRTICFGFLLVYGFLFLVMYNSKQNLLCMSGLVTSLPHTEQSSGAVVLKVWYAYH